MRSASNSPAARPGGRQQDHELLAAVARRYVAASNFALHALRELPQDFVADEVSVAIIDGFEMIHVDHQARERRKLAMAARELLAQSRLQVASVVPAGQDVGKPAAHEPRAVNRVLQAKSGDYGQVMQKIRCEMIGEATRLGAAHVETADDSSLPSQRQKRDAFE